MKKENHKLNFWREFKWRLLLITFLFIFIFTLISDILFNLNNWQQSLTTKKLLIRFALAVVLAFITRTWQQIDEWKKSNHKTT